MSLPPIRQDLTQSHWPEGQWPESRLIVGIWGRGKSATSLCSNLASLCCSSTHLVQCEPGWSRTQIWVQVHMPVYSLNWSAIQGGHTCQCCSSPTRRWPSRSRGIFGRESAIDFDTPSGTNARRPSQVSCIMRHSIITFGKNISA